MAIALVRVVHIGGEESIEEARAAAPFVDAIPSRFRESEGGGKPPHSEGHLEKLRRFFALAQSAAWRAQK